MKKILSIILCAGIIAAALAGCSSGGTNNASNAISSAIGTSDTSEKEANASLGLPTSLKAEKIYSVDADSHSSLDLYQSGMTYRDRESGLYGVMTHDGKHDTGAVYTRCEQVGDLFEVTKSKVDFGKVENVNVNGLIDGEGNTVLEEKYFGFKAISDRYYEAFEATGFTDNEDEALMYGTSEIVSFNPKDGDTLFTGKWTVYDVVKKQFVEGATGTKPYSVEAYGKYLSYRTDDENDYCISGDDGSAFPEHHYRFEDGGYTVQDTDKGSVYDADGNLLFTYDLEGFVPHSKDGEYYSASQYKDGESHYVLLDKTGKAVTAEFKDAIYIYGDYILCENVLYDFEGNKVIDEEIGSVRVEPIYKSLYLLKAEKNNEKYTVINGDGKVLFTNKDNSKLNLDSFPIKSKDGDETSYYCYKDNDFTIAGSYYIADGWLIEADTANRMSNLVDAISGETIIENYDSYASTNFTKDGCYVVATGNGTSDIYKITPQY